MIKIFRTSKRITILISLGIIIFLLFLTFIFAITWSDYPTIIFGLPDIGDISMPQVFNVSGTLYMISGSYIGDYYGFKWNGTGWEINSTINSTMINHFLYPYPSVYNNGTDWILIVGSVDSEWISFVWNGSLWNETTWTTRSMVNGLPSWGGGGHAKPSIFYLNDFWYLIAGNEAGNLNGFVWNGTHWKSNETINSSLVDVGIRASPSVFNISNNYYLFISSTITNELKGYSWNGTDWNINVTINDTLIGPTYSPFSYFTLNENNYLISGNITGAFNGYIFGVVPPTINLEYPINNQNFTTNTITFSTIPKSRINLTGINVSIYGNWSGGWHLNISNISSLNNTQTNFTFYVPSGKYYWGAYVQDLNGGNYSNINYTFNIDILPTTIINSPAGTFGSNNVTFNFTFVEDILFSICYYNVTTSGGGSVVTNQYINCSNAIDYQTISDGVDYKLNIFVNDSLNQKNVTQILFSVSVGTPYVPPSGGGGGTIIKQIQNMTKKIYLCEPNQKPFNEAFNIWKIDMFNWKKFEDMWRSYWDYSLCYNAGSVIPLEIEVEVENA